MKRFIIVILLFTDSFFVCHSSTTEQYNINDGDDGMVDMSTISLFTKLNTVMETTKLIVKYLNDSQSEINKKFNEITIRQKAQEHLLRNSCTRSSEWTTILKREDGSLDFQRNWTEYRNGFGNPPNGEFFIGLEKIYEMTTAAPHELIVILKDWNNDMRHAHYNWFEIGNEEEKYALKLLGNYTGDAGDALIYHREMKFSTLDQDNDNSSDDCAKKWKGGWWFNGCYRCHLNGPYRKEVDSKQNGTGWNTWHGYAYSLKFAEMKIRPKSFYSQKKDIFHIRT